MIDVFVISAIVMFLVIALHIFIRFNGYNHVWIHSFFHLLFLIIFFSGVEKVIPEATCDQIHGVDEVKGWFVCDVYMDNKYRGYVVEEDTWFWGTIWIVVTPTEGHIPIQHLRYTTRNDAVQYIKTWDFNTYPLTITNQ